MSDLSYPIGKFKFDGSLNASQRATCIDQIAETPQRMRAAVHGLNEEQLQTPYRPEGWTVRQVVHHVPDSHMNSYIRFKLAMTLEQPTINSYPEDVWAELPDAKLPEIGVSLNLLDTLHKRWVVFLQSLRTQDFQRQFHHPELGLVTLERNLALYAWHGRHHTAHITSLRDRLGW
jgi:uncharacterized damage-inducible protein DinB